MHRFLKLLIFPRLDALAARVIVEVGTDLRAVTGPLLDWAQANDATLHAIDPDPSLASSDWSPSRAGGCASMQREASMFSGRSQVSTWR